MKKILGLDLGTNSIGWSVIKNDFENKTGEILGLGSRIIPMSQDILGKFDSGQSISQTAERTGYRGVRRLYQRDNLRRERLHRVLNILDFLPGYYKSQIDFEKKLGQFYESKEPKINYTKNREGKYEFAFMDSFFEMVKEFEQRGQIIKIPFDWTLYYLRKKALKEKISKEELAWIILNFNQKRGYYQLRGEEEEISEEKIKSFEILIGDKAVENGDTLKSTGEKLYDLFFTNGWKYDKPIAKIENWIGKTKEFIVTTSTTNAGEIKRTFKAIDSEKDWIAIKEKSQQEIDIYNNKNNTIGVANYIYETLIQNPTQKNRGKLIKTIERKYYKQEFEKIIETQIKLQPELFTKELYQKCIYELYSRNEAHINNIKEKGFKYLLVEDIIFYQRPLKSKKSTISSCQFEFRTYNKINEDTGKLEKVKESIKAVSKSHPLYQEFRLWQFISNLKIYKKEDKSKGKLEHDVNVTPQFLSDENTIVELFEFINEKKEIEQKHIIDFFVKHKTISKQEAEEYRWNYVEDKKYPGNETRAQFLSRLKRVEGFDQSESFDKEFETNLWHIIYSVKDKKQYEKALCTFAVKYNIDKDSFVEAFEKFSPFKNEYGAFSEKALKKILPLMRMGKYWNYNDFDNKTKERIQKILDGEYDHKIRNRVRELVEKNQIQLKASNDFKALPTWFASYIVYNRHSEASDITKWNSPEDINRYLKDFNQHSLRNPIVEQVIMETLRTVRDIWIEYGDLNEIHVELGREMKNPADKRKQMTQRNSENESTNKRIKELLNELLNDGVDVKPYSPSHQEILKIYEEGIFKNPDSNYSSLKQDDIEKIRKKSSPSSNDIKRYKLWLEQGYISPYTGAIIPLNQLFTTNYQIEHIIPQSRYFDDSLSNKVICESEVNELKSNQTAYEFIKNNEGRVVDLQQGKAARLFTISSYEAHCNKYFSRNRVKLKKLLSEDIPEGFIQRQMNDSRYISKVVTNLLSNIVREDEEQEAISRNLVPVTGAITSKLKQDWGLNDKWNAIILPRFKRLNQITGRSDFTVLNSCNIEIPNIPEDIGKVEKKRIDHRHHALDALIIACVTKDHVNYITSLNTARKNYSLVSKLREVKERQKTDRQTGEIKTYMVATDYKKPWNNFTNDAKEALDKIIVSFKQNLRVINRTNNKTWQWIEKNGQPKKQLIAQKGKNFAIRKPMHTPLAYGEKIYNFSVLEISKYIGKRKLICDENIRNKIEQIFQEKGEKIGDTQKYLKINPLKDDKGEEIKFVDFNIPEIRYRKRQPIYKLANRGQGGIKDSKQAIAFINKVSDRLIKDALLAHLKVNDYNIDRAFSIDGIEEFNKNRKIPVYKLPIAEASTTKFPLGNKKNTKVKFGEAESGTNLFFAIYWDEVNQKRVYETVPLNEVIAHQKYQVSLSKDERKPIPIKIEKGTFLFALSPNDLVYVPTDEEKDNPTIVDFKNLNKEQMDRIYKMVSSTQGECHFIPNCDALEIIKNENGTNSKSERMKDFFKGNIIYCEKSKKSIMIKDRCWKLKVDRLGKINGVYR